MTADAFRLVALAAAAALVLALWSIQSARQDRAADRTETYMNCLEIADSRAEMDRC